MPEDKWKIDNEVQGGADSLNLNTMADGVTLTPERALLHEVIVQTVTERKAFDHSSSNYDEQFYTKFKELQQSDAYKALVEKGDFTKGDISKLLDNAGYEKLPNVPADQHITAMVTGGPATGKSGIAEALKQQNPDLFENAVRINPDDYKAILANPIEHGRAFADVAHRESSMLATSIMERLEEKLQAGKAPNIILDVVSPNDARMSLANKSDLLVVAVGTLPPEQTLDRSFSRYMDTGRQTPTEVVLDGGRKAAALTPSVLEHNNPELRIYSTDVPRGSPPVLVAELDPEKSVINVYDPDTFSDFVERKHINPQAQNAGELFPNGQTPGNIANSISDYTSRGITVNLLNPDGQIAISLTPEGIEKNAPLVSKRGNDFFDKVGEAHEKIIETSKPIDPMDVVADGNKPAAGTVDEVTDGTKRLAQGANAADDLSDAVKTVGQAADALKAGKTLSKTAKLSIIGGVALTGGVAALLHVAHKGQRDLAGELKDSGHITPEAHEAYMELNTDTEIMMQAENAAAQGWLFLLSTPAVESKANSDFKEWADKHAPNLSEEHFQALSMSLFPGQSARADMLWEARDQLPSTTEGQPELIHRSVDLNSLYEEANNLGYSHRAGVVIGGNLSETIAKAQAMGIEVDGRGDPAKAIQNLEEAIKQELVQELDQQFREPENIGYMLNQVPVEDRLEYARRLAGSESDPEEFAQDHPEIASYVKEHDESMTGWGWTLDNDDPLKDNPNLLNDYIKAKTQIGGSPPSPEEAPIQDTTAEEASNLSVSPTESQPEPDDLQQGQANAGGKPTPNDVIDRSADIDKILPPDANITVQSSDNNASVARGALPDEQISLMQNEDKDPATLPEIEREREMLEQQEQQRLQEQAAFQIEQQQQMGNPTANG